MDYEKMRVVDLKALVKEHKLRGYSKLKKAELIAFFRIILDRAPDLQDLLDLLPHLQLRLGLD